MSHAYFLQDASITVGAKRQLANFGGIIDIIQLQTLLGRYWANRDDVLPAEVPTSE